MELFDIHHYNFSHQCNLLHYVERVIKFYDPLSLMVVVNFLFCSVQC